MRHLNAWILLAAFALMLGLTLAYLPKERPEHVLSKITLSDVGGLVLSEDGALIDINSANERLLMSLPGIGEALAGRIAAHRTQHGAFHSVEELTQVPGIGEAKLNAIRERVTCVIP